MAIEVETKARLEEPETMRKKLRRIARFDHSFEKRDIYFSHPGGTKTLFRLRNEDNVSTVTYKKKTRERGFEVNQEHEFSVSDEHAFLGFCEYLGYIKYIEKHKTGDLFTYKQASIELTYVDDLGWFIEIECIVEDESEIHASRDKIHSILSDLEIDADRIEERYYVEMLMEKKRGTDGNNRTE
jgi:predicted adenylyl cyclase CyaB